MAADPPNLAGNGAQSAANATPETEEDVEEVEEIEEEEEEEEEMEEEDEDDDDDDDEPNSEAEEMTEEKKFEAAAAHDGGAEIKKWRGWPGDNVFRLVVPVVKVGGLIGRKGELIRKLCEETKASIRIFDCPVGSTERVVLITGKEEPEAEISRAMDAVLRVFKRVNELLDDVDGGTKQGSSPPVSCSARLMVAASQATSLIGKKGQMIKSIQEASGATVKILTGDELPPYVAADERIVEIQGESYKVLKALELILAHLRKFLVDHSVIPLFEKNYQALVSPVAQDHREDGKSDKAEKAASHYTQQSLVTNDYGPPSKRDSLYSSESRLDSQISRNELALYGQDPQPERRASRIGQTGAAFVTQITQTMQIPLVYAEDIIGIRGANIAYIRESSGAAITVQETRGYPDDEIIVEIKGTSSQVHAAHDLIQEFMGHHRRPEMSRFTSRDGGLRSTYSQLSSTPDSSSFLSAGHDPYDYSRLSTYKSFRS